MRGRMGCDRTGRTRLALAVAVLTAGVCVPSARGDTGATKIDGVITIQAAPGTKDFIVLLLDAGAYAVQPNDAMSTVTAGTGCDPLPAPTPTTFPARVVPGGGHDAHRRRSARSGRHRLPALRPGAARGDRRSRVRRGDRGLEGRPSPGRRGRRHAQRGRRRRSDRGRWRRRRPDRRHPDRRRRRRAPRWGRG